MNDAYDDRWTIFYVMESRGMCEWSIVATLNRMNQNRCNECVSVRCGKHLKVMICLGGEEFYFENVDIDSFPSKSRYSFDRTFPSSLNNFSTRIYFTSINIDIFHIHIFINALHIMLRFTNENSWRYIRSRHKNRDKRKSIRYTDKNKTTNYGPQ